jgi:hypothetical protein
LSKVFLPSPHEKADTSPQQTDGTKQTTIEINLPLLPLLPQLVSTRHFKVDRPVGWVGDSVTQHYQGFCRVSFLNPAYKLSTAPPSRRVQGRAKNVSGVYPSRKMGQTIQFESHTVELWAIYQMEHDPEVLEFYDQPPPFKIQYQNKTGRKIGHIMSGCLPIIKQQLELEATNESLLNLELNLAVGVIVVLQEILC